MVNRHGIAPLHRAAANGNAAIVKRLMAAGADANVATPAGETPLMMAARTGNAAAVEALIAKGAEVNAREAWRGQTALMWAASENNAEAIRVLVEAGADIHARSTSRHRSRRCCSRCAAVTSTRRARCSTPAPTSTSACLTA